MKFCLKPKAKADIPSLPPAGVVMEPDPPTLTLLRLGSEDRMCLEGAEMLPPILLPEFPCVYLNYQQFVTHCEVKCSFLPGWALLTGRVWHSEFTPALNLSSN